MLRDCAATRGWRRASMQLRTTKHCFNTAPQLSISMQWALLHACLTPGVYARSMCYKERSNCDFSSFAVWGNERAV